MGVGVVAVSLVGLLAGCGRTVSVPVPDQTDPAIVSQCSALNAALPSSVEYQVRQTTDPSSPLTAAWGSPPITLRCGVAKPAGLQPTSQLITVDGIDWFAEQRSAGYVFTTVGRTANVEVAVPDQYSPETNVLVDLTDPIKNAIPGAAH